MAKGLLFHGEWLKEKTADAAFSLPPDSRQHFDIWTFPTSDGTTSYFGAGRVRPEVVLIRLHFVAP